MTTAEALEGMTDTGRFEILATDVLRALHAECKTLAHIGVNAVGKTIPNPVDGFTRVPGVLPPLYVMAAFTAGGSDTLERKWLYEAAKTVKRKGKRKAIASEGDVVKAGREASRVRQDEATARFIVHLCSNRRLNLELMNLVYEKAKALSLDISFLEQSRLRDYLDTNPDGQWLREKFLGIEAERSSRSLLREIGHQSLRNYCAEMSFSESDEIVATEAGNAASEVVRNHSISLHLLVGPSGTGKTVIGQDLMRRHLEAGGMAVWLPGPIAERAASLPDALEEVLRALHPRIGKGEGHRALELATSDKPMLVVVDDVNRSRSTSTVLNRILGWCRLSSNKNGDGERQRSPIRVVCPLWNYHWHAMEAKLSGASWVRAQIIGPMGTAEAVNCLKASLHECSAVFSESELRELATQMRNDAILLGLFGRLFRRKPESSPKVLAEDIIETFVQISVSELSQETRVPTADYVSALTLLSGEMIRRKSLYPKWAELREWFAGSTSAFDALRQMASQQHVCKIMSREGIQRFEFRHDRLLEHFLSRAAAEILQGSEIDRESLSDPFFVPIVARALGRFRPSDAAVNWVTQRLPVALIGAIPCLPSPIDRRILDRAGTWLAECGTALESTRDDALATLVDIQSPNVLRVTSRALGCDRVWQARLRNGDPIAGARALCHRFFPAMSYRWLESLIEEAKSLHRGELISGLQEMLATSTTDEQSLKGAFCLAGYVGSSDLAGSVQIAWERAKDKRSVLLQALWAALRCSEDSPAEVLGAILPTILEIPDSEESGRMGARAYLLQDLAFASRHGINDRVISYLVDLGSAQEAYRWIVTALLEKSDRPLAVEHTVQQIARAKHLAEERGHFYPFAISWADQWTRRAREEGQPLSVSSLDKLRSLWAAESAPEWLRSFAFSVWINCHPDPIANRSLLEQAPSGDATLWLRAKRGDVGVAADVADRVKQDPHWLHVARHIWCKEIETCVDPWLGRVGTEPGESAWNDRNFHLAELLRDIRRDDAQKLLLRHWSKLVYCL